MYRKTHPLQPTYRPSVPGVNQVPHREVPLPQVLGKRPAPSEERLLVSPNALAGETPRDGLATEKTHLTNTPHGDGLTVCDRGVGVGGAGERLLQGLGRRPTVGVALGHVLGAH